MKKEHKLQRNLDSTFEAELKLCSLSGLTTWWHQMVCVGSGHGPWPWLSGAHLPGSCTCGGQRRGGRQRLWAPEGGAVLLLRPGPDGRDAGGVSGSSASGAEHPAPQSAGATTEELPSPRVSAASLRTLRSLYLRPSFFCTLGFIFIYFLWFYFINCLILIFMYVPYIFLIFSFMVL